MTSCSKGLEVFRLRGLTKFRTMKGQCEVGKVDDAMEDRSFCARDMN